MQIRRTRRVSEPPNPHYTRTPRDRRWRDRIHWPSVTSAAAVLLIAIVAVYVVLQDSPARGAADRAAVVAKPTAVPGPPVPSSKTPEYSPPVADRIDGDGQWIVGKQVRPGVYRTTAGPRCYWERLAGLSGKYADLLQNGGFRRGPALVEIRSTDFAFTSQNCAPWQLVMDR